MTVMIQHLKNMIFVLSLFMWLVPSQLNAQTKQFSDPLLIAVEKNAIEELDHLVKNGYSINKPNKDGITPLMRASFKGNNEMVKRLIKLGANVDVVDIGGATPLHMAARKGHTKVAESLLSGLAYIDPIDNEGMSPLMRAIIDKKNSTAEFLIAAGASTIVQDNKGKTLLYHAVNSGNHTITKLLLRKGAGKYINLAQQAQLLDLAARKNNKALEQMIASIAVPTQIIIPTSGTQKSSAISSTLSEAEKALINKITDENTKRPTKPNTSQLPQPTSPSKKRGFLKEYIQPSARPRTSSVQEVSKPAQKAVELIRVDKTYFLMQLGVVSQLQNAQRLWEKLSQKHGDLLVGLQSAFIPITKRSGKTAYRVRAGVFQTKERAKSTCSALLVRNVACFVVETTVLPADIAAKIVSQREPTPASLPSTRSIEEEGGVVTEKKPQAVNKKEKQHIAPVSKTPVKRTAIEGLPWVEQDDYYSLLRLNPDTLEPVEERSIVTPKKAPSKKILPKPLTQTQEKKLTIVKPKKIAKPQHVEPKLAKIDEIQVDPAPVATDLPLVSNLPWLRNKQNVLQPDKNAAPVPDVKPLEKPAAPKAKFLSPNDAVIQKEVLNRKKQAPVISSPSKITNIAPQSTSPLLSPVKEKPEKKISLPSNKIERAAEKKVEISTLPWFKPAPFEPAEILTLNTEPPTTAADKKLVKDIDDIEVPSTQKLVRDKEKVTPSSPPPPPQQKNIVIKPVPKKQSPALTKVSLPKEEVQDKQEKVAQAPQKAAREKTVSMPESLISEEIRKRLEETDISQPVPGVESSKPLVRVAEAVKVPLVQNPQTATALSRRKAFFQDTTDMYWVRLSGFSNEKDANRFLNNVVGRQQLKQGLRTRIVRAAAKSYKRKTSLAVKVGVFSDLEEAKNTCRKLKRLRKKKSVCMVVRDLGKHKRRRKQVTPDTSALTPPSAPSFAGEAKSEGLYYKNNQYYYWIQLGSFRNTTDPKLYWSRLKDNYHALLGNKRSLIVKVRRKVRGKHIHMYRLRTGPFVKKEDALSICMQLRSHNVGCVLTQSLADPS